MKIGKLINGQLQGIELIESGDRLVYNATIQIDGDWVSNPTEDHMLELGYKSINESAKPELLANEYAIESYSETENEIAVSYDVKVQEPFKIPV